MIASKTVQFWVKVDTSPPEKVFVTGSLPELGSWEPNNALQLKPLDGSENEWQLNISAKFKEPFSFRYFVGIILTTSEPFGKAKEHIVIKRWETSLCSRKSDEEDDQVPDYFGVYTANENAIKPLKPMIGIGCLRTASAVQIMVKPNAITWWKKGLKEQQIFYKLESLHCDGEVSAECSNIEIAALNDEETTFRQQNTTGRKYDAREFVIFNMYTMDPRKIAIRVSFYIPHALEPFATTVIALVNHHDTVEIPILEKMSLIGFMKVSYLLIKPIRSHPFDFNADFTTFTATMQMGIHVGHKGSGNWRRTDTPEKLLENTIASLDYAAENGADMVEFDVVLTKDHIPVLYHDFVVNVSLNKKGSQELEPYPLEIKKLTYNQMQNLKVGPVPKHDHPQFEFIDHDVARNQPFPMLETVLRTVKPVAFNLEIKYPTDQDDGIDPNEYVDSILKTVFENGGKRDIVISCFDPDVCSLLRMKQNKYPVSFLTRGLSKKFRPATDLRMTTVEMATYFALCMNLTGINCHAEDIIKELYLVRFVISRGLILFCWGDDINACSVIEKLAKEGVHGLIYDKIDMLSPKSKLNGQRKL